MMMRLKILGGYVSLMGRIRNEMRNKYGDAA